jgi:hypothetical protein
MLVVEVVEKAMDHLVQVEAAAAAMAVHPELLALQILAVVVEAVMTTRAVAPEVRAL